jgi:hypothetical protein
MENIKDPGSKMDHTNSEKQESGVTTASNAFLWAALGSVAASLTLKLLKRNPALAVGIGVPAFLIFGIYKLVRQNAHGSD